MQRASDILAEKLPGLQDPNAPPPQQGAAGPDGVDLRPLKPLTAARPDRFSPSEVRPASQMTPGKAAPITPSQGGSEVTNGNAPVKRPKKPHSDGDGTISSDGSTKPAPHTNQDSFIIPGTATGPDRPLVNPEKTGAEKTSAAIAPAAGAASREQHQ
jgi:rod shape-determining protein MreC